MKRPGCQRAIRVKQIKSLLQFSQLRNKATKDLCVQRSNLRCSRRQTMESASIPVKSRNSLISVSIVVYPDLLVRIPVLVLPSESVAVAVIALGFSPV